VWPLILEYVVHESFNMYHCWSLRVATVSKNWKRWIHQAIGRFIKRAQADNPYLLQILCHYIYTITDSFKLKNIDDECCYFELGKPHSPSRLQVSGWFEVKPSLVYWRSTASQKIPDLKSHLIYYPKNANPNENFNQTRQEFAKLTLQALSKMLKIVDIESQGECFFIFDKKTKKRYFQDGKFEKLIDIPLEQLKDNDNEDILLKHEKISRKRPKSTTMTKEEQQVLHIFKELEEGGIYKSVFFIPIKYLLERARSPGFLSKMVVNQYSHWHLWNPRLIGYQLLNDSPESPLYTEDVIFSSEGQASLPLCKFPKHCI
jgi:hypothetical protein